MRNAVVKVPIAGDSVMPRQSLTMPPPPSISANPKSLMPPPPSIATETLEMPPPPSKPVMPEQVMMPPPNPVENKSNDVQFAMPPPAKVNKDVPPQKKKIHGPRCPPSNIQGTLAALTQTSSHSQTGATSTERQKKKTQMISNPKEDLWKAPADQDGSGRTALNDKFKGRY